MKKAKDIDEYISWYPKATQKLLQEVRATANKAAPKSTEVISYAMPAIKQHGVLVFYAAYENHIGFYPTASGIENFTKEITPYKSSKGAVQFPLDRPLPLPLITKMVKFRVAEDIEKQSRKKK